MLFTRSLRLRSYLRIAGLLRRRYCDDVPSFMPPVGVDPPEDPDEDSCVTGPPIGNQAPPLPPQSNSNFGAQQGAQASVYASQPSAQPPAQAAQPSAQPPAQAGQPSAQPPAQAGQPSAQPVAQSAQPSAQPPAQAGQPSAQPATQAGQQASQSGQPSALQGNFQAPSQQPLPKNQGRSLTTIVCTLGPSSRGVDTIEKLIINGMRIARLNFSYGNHAYHRKTLTNVRVAVGRISEKIGRVFPLPIALDTKGPEIRTGLINGDVAEEVMLNANKRILVTTNDSFSRKCSDDIIFVDYPNLLKVIKPGNRIFIDDGMISLLVQEIRDDGAICIVQNPGILGSYKGVNVPEVDVHIRPTLSDKDKEDLEFGVKEGFDIIFASFIRSSKTIKEMRNVLGDAGKHLKIIAKIENRQGLENLNEIVEAADGIMIARGDLGISIPPPKVFVAQKKIIDLCNNVGKPVICATQMLESMTSKPRPTRAEVTDVANAVLDGADCVMLSSETARGRYPVETVRMMADICLEAENKMWSSRFDSLKDVEAVTIQKVLQYFQRRLRTDDIDFSEAICASAAETSFKIRANAIVVFTSNGSAAFSVAKYRPACPILAAIKDPQVARQIRLYRGIIPIIVSRGHDEDITERTLSVLSSTEAAVEIKPGAPVIVVYRRDDVAESNSMIIIRAK